MYHNYNPNVPNRAVGFREKPVGFDFRIGSIECILIF
jgi:hypothetical protein